MASESGAAEWVFDVEAGKVREFARAVHDAHARDEPLIAPPTFPVCISADYIDHLVNDVLRLDRGRTLHGEQEYEYLRPLRPGERLLCQARILEDFVKEGKRGGRMRFVVCETVMRNAQTGEVVLRERSTSIETAPRAEQETS
jgi:hypothetical protein